MFNIQVDTLDVNVLNAFSNFFAELAHHSAQNGAAVIRPEDRPDAGTDTVKLPVQATTTAAAVFGATPAADAAAVFGGNGQGVQIADTATGQACSTGTQTLGDVAASAEVIAPPPPADAATVFAPNVTAASIPNASGAANVLDPAQNTSNAPAQPSVTLDANGLPWDARIHAGTRTQTAQNVWKKKKGVDDATVASVEAELRAALNAPAKPFVPLNVAAEGSVAPPPPVAATVAPPPPNVAPSATVPAPPLTTAQQPAASVAPTTFAELCKYVTGRGLNAQQILSVCNAHGLAGLGLVACRPDLIPSMYTAFSAL